MTSWINTLRTSAEDLGTFAENEPPTDMVAERGCRVMADRKSRRAVGVEQKEAKGNEQEFMKVESELQKTGGGIIAPMNKNLVPWASAGESKVFYYKIKGDYYRYFA